MEDTSLSSAGNTKTINILFQSSGFTIFKRAVVAGIKIVLNDLHLQVF